MIVTSLGRKIVIVLAALAVAIVGMYIIWRWMQMTDGEMPHGIHGVPEETRSVTLFFVSNQADRLLPETREIAVEDGIEKQVGAVISELIGGPGEKDRVSAIPAGAEVLQVFWVEESRMIYLDMNRSFVSNHPGGSTAEYYTIGMIARTICTNFPQAQKLQLLVEGYPVETLAGHYAVDKPIDILRWR